MLSIGVEGAGMGMTLRGWEEMENNDSFIHSFIHSCNAKLIVQSVVLSLDFCVSHHIIASRSSQAID